MAKTAGRWVEIFFAGYVLTGWSNQFDAVLEHDETDATCFLDGAKNSFPGLAKAIASATSFFNPATNKTHDAFKGQVGSYTDKELMILIGANTTPAIGDPAFMMVSKEFTYQTPMEVASAIMANVSLSSQKMAAWGIVLANTTITNTTSFASVDNAYGSASEARVILQAMSVLPSDTYVVKLQDSINDADWVDVDTFVALDGSAIGSESQVVAALADVIDNRSFEGGITGWAASAGASIAQSAVQAFEGSYSLLLTSGTGGANAYYAETDKVAGYAQADQIFVDAHVYVDEAWPDDFDIYVAEYTAGDGYLSQVLVGTVTTIDGWARIRGTIALTEATVNKITLRIGEPVAKDFSGGAVTAFIDLVTCREANINRFARLLATRTGAAAESLRIAAALDRGKLS